MKLEGYKDTYEGASGTLSNINRQIAFAGIAIIWIFKKSNDGDILIREELILPAIFLLIALSIDMFQYMYTAIAWAIFYRVKEVEQIKNNVEEDILAPTWMNYPTWILFGFKILGVIAAYYLIVTYLIDTLT
jgi:hypothetical protein